jgi:hypothetical protein
LPNAETFYKLVVVDIVNKNINNCRTTLHQEMYHTAIDPTLFKRRFRMLAQLADYESQIYKKIYEFDSKDINDYTQALHEIVREIKNVIDRSG